MAELVVLICDSAEMDDSERRRLEFLNGELLLDELVFLRANSARCTECRSCGSFTGELFLEVGFEGESVGGEISMTFGFETSMKETTLAVSSPDPRDDIREVVYSEAEADSKSSNESAPSSEREASSSLERYD